MKRKLINYFPLSLVIFFVSFFNIALKAQNNNSFVGFRSGISIPFGEFGSQSLDKGNFAQLGFQAAAEGAWFFKPHYGIGASVGVNFHPIDVSGLGAAMVQSDPFLDDVYIRSESFLTIATMAGPYIQFPLSNKFSFTGKFLIGMLYGQTPYQLYKPDFFGVDVPFYEITSSRDWKFSWMAGVGLRYDISPCFGFVFDSEFMYDTLKFNFNTLTGTRTDKEMFAIINLSLGIRLVL